MTVGEVTSFLGEICPLSYAEDFDNVGLLVGDNNAEVCGVLVTLDTLEKTIDKAIKEGCNLIVSFHPIIFSGLKKITGRTYVERVVEKAILNKISIYSMHTALDNVFNGTNGRICETLNLKNREILIEKENTIKKLVTFVPKDYVQKVKEALFNAGAGAIGKYSECCFSLEGKGSFKAGSESNPFVGEIGKTHIENEVQIGVIFDSHLKNKVLKNLFASHPYEEVAYEIYSLENFNQEKGMGMIGELDREMTKDDFLQYLKDKMGCKCVRYNKDFPIEKKIKKVAVLGGSGAFAIEAASVKGADAFVTADVKYHEFYKAEGMLVADIGHYESEQYNKDLLCELVSDKFGKKVRVLVGEETNSVDYFC